MKKTVFILTAAIVSACGVGKKQFTNTTYEQVRNKADEPKTITYTIPSVQPTGKTQQTQTKGGVTISVEVEPFTVSGKRTESRVVAVADPSKPGYDRYEIINAPDDRDMVRPERVIFKIRVRNNEQVPLVLGGIGFVLIIDGVQYSFPKERIEEWNRGMVVTGFEKTYEVPGPQVSELRDGQTVYLFLNGVPVSYNTAGAVTKKVNFEWYFTCKNETKTAEDKITYRYDFVPIHNEQCKSCTGVGYISSWGRCSMCAGTGRRTIDGKVYTCSYCKGTGKEEVKNRCANCSGKGSLSFPKSAMPRVLGTETWTGWSVKITTIPSGIPVRIVDTRTRQYVNAGTSNCTVNWYNSSRWNFPIILDYGGKEYKIMPMKPNGKESKSVTVDFTGGEPVITGGTKTP